MCVIHTYTFCFRTCSGRERPGWECPGQSRTPGSRRRQTASRASVRARASLRWLCLRHCRRSGEMPRRWRLAASCHKRALRGRYIVFACVWMYLQHKQVACMHACEICIRSCICRQAGMHASCRRLVFVVNPRGAGLRHTALGAAVSRASESRRLPAAATSSAAAAAAAHARRVGTMELNSRWTRTLQRMRGFPYGA